MPNLSDERKQKGGEHNEDRNIISGSSTSVWGIGAGSSFAAAEGVISNTVLIPGSYCQLTFPAIREETLDWDRPVLKDASSGDIIDYFGSCDHDPLGQDEIEWQRREPAWQLRKRLEN